MQNARIRHECACWRRERERERERARERERERERERDPMCVWGGGWRAWPLLSNRTQRGSRGAPQWVAARPTETVRTRTVAVFTTRARGAYESEVRALANKIKRHRQPMFVWGGWRMVASMAPLVRLDERVGRGAPHSGNYVEKTIVEKKRRGNH